MTNALTQSNHLLRNNDDVLS